jgi:hypothetical protein
VANQSYLLKANIHNEDFTNFFQARFSHFNSIFYIKIKPSQPETTLIQQQRRSTLHATVYAGAGLLLTVDISSYRST